MSQLTSKFESETGDVAMYRKGGADYHTLRYVNWLEALVEKFNSALRQPTKQGSEPSEICPKCKSVANNYHRNKFACTNRKCRHEWSGKLLPC